MNNKDTKPCVARGLGYRVRIMNWDTPGGYLQECDDIRVCAENLAGYQGSPYEHMISCQQESPIVYVGVYTSFLVMTVIPCLDSIGRSKFVDPIGKAGWSGVIPTLRSPDLGHQGSHAGSTNWEPHFSASKQYWILAKPTGVMEVGSRQVWKRGMEARRVFAK